MPIFDVSTEDLFRIIGETYVENYLLERRVILLEKKLIEKEQVDTEITKLDKERPQ